MRRPIGFLVMAEAARQDLAEAVIVKFPPVEIVSRDRGGAHGAAAAARGKVQVADSLLLALIQFVSTSANFRAIPGFIDARVALRSGLDPRFI